MQLHKADIDLLQRAAAAAAKVNSGKATRRRRRSSVPEQPQLEAEKEEGRGRPPIAPIKIKLKMNLAAGGETKQRSPGYQKRSGHSLSAILAEIVREPSPRKASPSPVRNFDDCDWLPPVTPRNKARRRVFDEPTRSLVETVSSITQFYALEFCQQLMEEVAAAAYAEAAEKKQEEDCSVIDIVEEPDMVADKDMSSTDLMKEDMNIVQNQPDTNTADSTDREATSMPVDIRLEPALQSRAEAEIPADPLSPQAVEAVTPEPSEMVAEQAATVEPEVNMTSERRAERIQSPAKDVTEPHIVVKIAKIHMVSTGGSSPATQSPNTVNSQSRSLRRRSLCEQSSHKVTSPERKEGSLKIVISPTKLQKTRRSEKVDKICLNMNGPKLVGMKGKFNRVHSATKLAAKGRKGVYASLQKRKRSAGLVAKRRKLQRKGKKTETAPEQTTVVAAAPEKVSYVTVLKMHEIVSMRPVVLPEKQPKVDCIKSDTIINSRQTMESEKVRENLQEKMRESPQEKMQENTPEKMRENPPSPCLVEKATEIALKKVPVPKENAGETTKLALVPLPPEEVKPTEPDVPLLDSGGLPELEDEFIQDLPVLPPLHSVSAPVLVQTMPSPASADPVLQSKTLAKCSTILATVSASLAREDERSRKKKKKKHAKRTPPSPALPPKRLPTPHKSQAELILAKIPPLAPMPVASRRNSSSSSGTSGKSYKTSLRIGASFVLLLWQLSDFI